MMRHYLFFALPIVLATALAWLGILPPADWTEVVKWSVIVGACTVFAVGFGQGFGQGFASALALRHCRPPTAPDPTQDGFPPGFFDTEETGTGMPASGIFSGGDIFARPIGSDVPNNYTSLERDPGTPPVTTEGAMGQAVTVPIGASPGLQEFDPEFGVLPGVRDAPASDEIRDDIAAATFPKPRA